jgi:hypothetical protein
VTSHQFTLLQENQQQRKINQATTTGITLEVGKFKDKKTPCTVRKIWGTSHSSQ